MAFVRKKGKSFYLVHNVREEGRVRQVHLACLGNRPRITDDVVRQVRQAHPDLEIDWAAVRQRANESFASPFTDPEGVRQLIASIRGLVLDMGELDIHLIARQASEIFPELIEEMRVLRSALEQKLSAWTGRPPESVSLPASPEQEGKFGS